MENEIEKPALAVVPSVKIVQMPKREDTDESPHIVRYRNRIIQLWNSGLYYKEIAERLCAEGTKAPKGGDASESSVRSVATKLFRAGIISKRVNPLATVPMTKGDARPPVSNRLWCAILHSTEIDDTTRTLLLRIITERG